MNAEEIAKARELCARSGARWTTTDQRRADDAAARTLLPRALDDLEAALRRVSEAEALLARAETHIAHDGEPLRGGTAWLRDLRSWRGTEGE